MFQKFLSKHKMSWFIFFQLALLTCMSYLENRGIVSHSFHSWLKDLTFLSWAIYFCYQLLLRTYRGFRKKALYQEIFEGIFGLMLMVLLSVGGIILAIYLHSLYQNFFAHWLQFPSDSEFIRHLSGSTFAIFTLFLVVFISVGGRLRERSYMSSLMMLLVMSAILVRYLTIGITTRRGKLRFPSYWESTDPYKNYLVMIYIGIILVSGLTCFIARYFSKKEE